MTSRSPRINVVLDDTLYNNIHLLAQKDGVSLSAKVRELISEALELQEDAVLAAFAETREASLDGTNALSHEEVWK